MSVERILVIGDVHGCADELQELLDQADPSSFDHILFIGDLINKGPDSVRCYEIYKDLGASAILGNHEYGLLQQVSQDNPKSIYHRMCAEFGAGFDALIADLSSWPGFVEHEHFTAVHAGLVPGQDLDDTPVTDLVNIRTWDGKGDDLQNPENPPWFHFYEEEHLVVFGHWAALGGVVRDHVIGLDTGCVYGRELTALVLPERRLISVAAKEVYCPISNGDL